VVRKVIHSNRSIGNVERICKRVSEADPTAARKLGEDLLAASARLGQFPKMSRFYRNHAKGELRELPCRGYRIFYLVRDESSALEVVHIRHGARDEPDFL